MDIQIVGEYGPHCGHTTYGELAQGAPAIEWQKVPEFRLSPRAPRGAWQFGATNQPAPVQGPFKPILKNGVTVGERREVGAIEHGWLNMMPFFKSEPTENKLTPIGTVPTLEGLGHFFSRVAEIAAIEDTTCCEYHKKGGEDFEHNTNPRDLPTAQQELAAMGVGTLNLSSSPSSSEDDDLQLEIAEPELESTTLLPIKEFTIDPQLNHDARRYGTPYTTQDLAPIVRRIEWEKQVMATNKVPLVKVQLDVQGDIVGTATLPDSAIEAELAQRLFTTLGQPDAPAVKDMMGFSDYYGVVGSLLYTPQRKAESLEQNMDDLGAEDLMEPEEMLQGAQELGLHSLSNDEDAEELGRPDFEVLPEPSEFDLWPLDEAV